MGGGVLNEHGSHYIDALHQWLGDIRSVSAQVETFVPQRRGPGGEADAEDFFTATFDMAQGRRGGTDAVVGGVGRARHARHPGRLQRHAGDGVPGNDDVRRRGVRRAGRQ